MAIICAQHIFVAFGGFQPLNPRPLESDPNLFCHILAVGPLASNEIHLDPILVICEMETVLVPTRGGKSVRIQ